MAAPNSSGSLTPLITSLRTLGDHFLALVTLECQEAGKSLAWMLGLALVAAVLAITGWLTILAAVVLILVQNQILSWEWALSIAALLSFAGAGTLMVMAIQQSRYLLFRATRRQLRRISNAKENT